MKLKKYVKKSIVLAFIVSVLSVSYSNAEFSAPARTSNKPIKVVSAQSSDSTCYQEQGKKNKKINGILFPGYLVHKKVTDTKYTSDYNNNGAMGLRTNVSSIVHYKANLKNPDMRTTTDKNSGVSNLAGPKYLDYTGDVVWNYNRSMVGETVGVAVNVGSIDNMRNFKPSQTNVNTKYVVNQWPKYPRANISTDASDTVSTSVPSGANKAAAGSDYLLTEPIKGTGSYSFKTKFRNENVKDVVGSDTRLRGEWRYIGSNAEGQPISNAMFVAEIIYASENVNKQTVLKETWNELSDSERGKYNKTSITNVDKAIRDRTMNKFVSVFAPKRGTTTLTAANCVDYFNIESPYGANVSGVVRSNYTSGDSTSYKATVIPAEGRIDVEVTSMKIKNDKGQTLYQISQTTNKNGVTVSSPTISDSTGKIKLQPGKIYTVETSLKNYASGHIVYNPTLNVLLDTITTDTDDFISAPNKADILGIYTLGNMRTENGVSNLPTLWRTLNRTTLSTPDKGWYTILGNRRLSGSNGQKMVAPKNSNNTIAGKGTKSMTMNFEINTVSNESEMKTYFGTKDPNGIQMRMAAQLNDKHQISDNVWYEGGISKVDTSVDDLYYDNNTLSTTSWSASQDLSISGSNDYTLKDANGNAVKDEILKGRDYTLRVNVYNGSKIWGTSMAPKVNYVVKDAATGEVVVEKKVASAKNKIAKSTSSKVSSTYIDIPINVGTNVRAKDIIIEVEISQEHNANYDDWYEANNKFALKLGLRSPVDLVIKESMGDIVGDGLPNEIVVFSGETVNIMSEISSNVDYGVGPVKIKFTRTPANEVVEKKVSSLDMSNTQEVAYTFKAPTVLPSESDKIYTVTAEINPEGVERIEEINYNNNKVTFSVRVTGDISKYGCTSIIRENLDDKGRPSGLARGYTEKNVDGQFTSYIPTITVKRRDKMSGSFGDWYDYPIQLKSAQLKVNSKESHVIESVLFKSKFTTDRYAEKLDRDKIDSEGFVDILKYPKYAKVKAGYGFEVKVKTLYKTDLKESYEKGIANGMDTKLNTGKTVYEEVLSRVNVLNQNDYCELKTGKDTMKVVFTPSPETVTMNAKDEVLCMMMPNGKEVYTSIATSKRLVERMSREEADRNNVYSQDTGVEFNYQFTSRESGMLGEDSRRYYIDENTTNTTNTNRYYMRLATNKIGVGGLTHAVNNGVYDMKDVEIIVYGGRDEDLKDTSN